VAIQKTAILLIDHNVRSVVKLSRYDHALSLGPPTAFTDDWHEQMKRWLGSNFDMPGRSAVISSPRCFAAHVAVQEIEIVEDVGVVRIAIAGGHEFDARPTVVAAEQIGITHVVENLGGGT